MADKLKKFDISKSSVSGCYVRERFAVLSERFRKKNREKMKATGNSLLQDTHDLIRDATEILGEDQRQKQKRDRKRADKNRKHSLETMVETREREGPPHKRKSQKKDDMSYSHEGIIPQWKKENSS